MVYAEVLVSRLSGFFALRDPSLGAAYRGCGLNILHIVTFYVELLGFSLF